jgi:16S rRNA (guanine966-N2)-methyltransferase
LFSSIGASVPDARVLDLYAGTGAMGIEALSRGAASALFVDRSPAAGRAIRENLRRARLSDRGRVEVADAAVFVRRDDTSGGPFDLVLVDPPYETGGSDLDGVLADLASRWLSGRNWTVVLTRGSRSSMPVIPVDCAVARRLEYGDTLVLVIRQS